MTFKVRRKACKTCIYRKDSPLDLAALEAAVKDEHGFFSRWRICHHEDGVCCRGFWNRHGDAFPAGQLASRLGLVRFVKGTDYE